MNKQNVITLLEKINPDAAKKLAEYNIIDDEKVVDGESEWLQCSFHWGYDYDYWENVCKQIDDYNSITFALCEVKSMLKQAFIAGYYDDESCEQKVIDEEFMKSSIEKILAENL